MSEELLINLIEQGLSIRQIQKETSKSNGTVRYWLKKFELKTKHNQCNKADQNKSLVCSRCGNEKERSEFYRRRKNTESVLSYCKECMKEYTLQRFIDLKINLIKYKGGKCKKCSLALEKSHYCVFEFHHRDPSKKDVDIFNKKQYAAFDVIKDEIDKCDLLCANCHRLVHVEMRECLYPL